MNYYVHENPNPILSISSAETLKYSVCDDLNYYVHGNPNNYYVHGNSQTPQNRAKKIFNYLLCLDKTIIIILFKKGYSNHVPVEVNPHRKVYNYFLMNMQSIKYFLTRCVSIGRKTVKNDTRVSSFGGNNIGKF